jgi:hypothetical protein
MLETVRRKRAAGGHARLNEIERQLTEGNMQ